MCKTGNEIPFFLKAVFTVLFAQWYFHVQVPFGVLFLPDYPPSWLLPLTDFLFGNSQPPSAFLKCFGRSCSQRNSFRSDLAFLMGVGDPAPPTLRPFNTTWHLCSQCILGKGWIFRTSRVTSWPRLPLQPHFPLLPQTRFYWQWF